MADGLSDGIEIRHIDKIDRELPADEHLSEKSQNAMVSFAWSDHVITGRKRFQAATRFDLPVFEFDGAHVKVNPLASWTAADIATYVAAHRLPPHPLVAQGYRSIGCAPCTSIVQPGEDPRAGRWLRPRRAEARALHRARHADS